MEALRNPGTDAQSHLAPLCPSFFLHTAAISLLCLLKSPQTSGQPVAGSPLAHKSKSCMEIPRENTMLALLKLVKMTQCSASVLFFGGWHFPQRAPQQPSELRDPGAEFISVVAQGVCSTGGAGSICAPHPPDKALDNTLASAYKPYHIFLNQSWEIHHCCRSMSLVVSGAYAEEMPGGPTSGSLSLQLVQVGGGV